MPSPYLCRYYMLLTPNSLPMTFKIIAFKFILLSMTCVAHAQIKADPDVIASCGSHFLVPGLHMDFTMGEFMVQTLNTNPRFTQGFHQPGLDMKVGFIHPSFTNTFRFYPNPTRDILYMTIDEAGVFEFQLFDLAGRVMKKENFSSSLAIELNALHAGIYPFAIYQNDKLLYSNILEIAK